MTIDKKRLRALASAATQPGPWMVKRTRLYGADACTVIDANGFWVADCGADKVQPAFIASVDPQTVIALLDQLAALAAARDKACEIAAGLCKYTHAPRVPAMLDELRKVGT